MKTLAHVDMETAEQAVLAAQIAGAAEADTPPEKVAPHVRQFYRRMMSMIGKEGIAEESQAARSLKALALKEQRAPSRTERFGRRDRQKAVKKLVEEGKITQPKTRRTKDTPAIIDPRVIDGFIARLPDDDKLSIDTVRSVIGATFGYRDPVTMQRALRRSGRFVLGSGGQRMPAHVRSAAVMSSALMVATATLFPEQAGPSAVQATALLRRQFGATA